MVAKSQERVRRLLHQEHSHHENSLSLMGESVKENGRFRFWESGQAADTHISLGSVKVLRATS